MKVEFSSVPAIHLAGEDVVRQRRVWNVIASDAELAALRRVANAVAEDADRFPLDEEAVRVLAGAIEVMELVAMRKDSAAGG
jgi:hypothetical protein